MNRQTDEDRKWGNEKKREEIEMNRMIHRWIDKKKKTGRERGRKEWLEEWRNGEREGGEDRRREREGEIDRYIEREKNSDRGRQIASYRSGIVLKHFDQYVGAKLRLAVCDKVLNRESKNKASLLIILNDANNLKHTNAHTHLRGPKHVSTNR